MADGFALQGQPLALPAAVTAAEAKEQAAEAKEQAIEAKASDEAGASSGAPAAAKPCVRTSFDEKWEEFQRRFDKLLELGAKALSGMVEGGPVKRPPELVDEFRIAQLLRRSSRVVVLTGAGVSAESGIPTFRGADGYWTVGSKNYQPQELATWEKFNELPEEIWRWYQYRWGLCRQSAPNPGHHALVELMGLVENGFELVTQNVDGLHLLAGSDPARLCEIHGRIDQMRCDENVTGACLHELDLNDPQHLQLARSTVMATPKPANDEREEQLPRCPKCGVRQRPKILFFDECYNEALYKSKTAMAATEACDLLLIVGTQLSTGLPSRMVQAAFAAGAVVVRMDPIVDLQDPQSAGMLYLQAKSGEALPRIVAELRSLREEPLLAPLAHSGLANNPVAAGKAVRASPQTAPKAGRARAPSAAAANLVARESQVLSSSRASSVSGRVSLKVAACVTLAAGGAGSGKTSKAGAQVLAAAAKGLAAGSVSSVRRAALAADRTSKVQGQGKVQAEGFFVYGTLRPDDDSGAGWTEGFCKGLRVESAILQGASLYIEGHYPALCLEQTRCRVRGVFLSPEQEANPEGGCCSDVLASKLAQADGIEGYPDNYHRTVVEVQVEGATRHAYVYHRTGRTNRKEHLRIADGDWLSRPRAVGSGKGS
mmetsp:Transcript_125275/g.267418  ORF Transcript_125275/g.267418 Transcript_125275/m.267418 type:complete len:657 (-) Transcript_125275:116-2086(-)